MTRRLRVATDEACDRAALEAVLACAEDRPPRLERGDLSTAVSFVQMNWTRLDSPKREASMRISMLNQERIEMHDADSMRDIAVRILRTALDDHVTADELNGWHRDLIAVAAVTATDAAEAGLPSFVDFCHASAGTPWSNAFADRGSSTVKGEVERTLGPDDMGRLLPTLPDVVLVRKADFSKKGGARVVLGTLHGHCAFADLDTVTRLRMHARIAARATRSDETEPA